MVGARRMRRPAAPAALVAAALLAMPVVFLHVLRAAFAGQPLAPQPRAGARRGAGWQHAGRALARGAAGGAAAVVETPAEEAAGAAAEAVEEAVERAVEQAVEPREGAKAALLEACEAFRAKQEEMWEVMDRADVADGSKKGKKSGPSLLEAESFASQKVLLSEELEALRNATAAAIERLAALSPTPEPLRGWRGFGGAAPKDCALNGTWKLLFTDAADATFRRGKRGNATTFQEIDADTGWFINCVDFDSPSSKLRGFRVFVEGAALNEKEVQLSFRKVRLLRRSRFPKLFGEVTIPLPNPSLLRKLGRWLARAMGGKPNQSDRGAGFKLLYVDGDLRVHQTFDGLFFVQRRLA